jgi:hypothetical protein
LKFTKSRYEGNDETLIILPSACWHIGHVNCRYDIIKNWVKRLDNSHRGLLMGDMLEFATKESIGHGLYDTDMTPQKQIDYVIELLEPVKNYIDGAVIGNHEDRCVKSTSIDPMKNICQALQIPYLGYQGFIKYAWNGVGYIVNMWHGTGTGSTAQAAIKQAETMSERSYADVYLLAHHHKMLKSDRVYTLPDPRNMTLQKIEQHFVVCGSALDYNEGYADMKGLQSRRLGFPEVHLRGDKKKGKQIHVLI